MERVGDGLVRKLLLHEIERLNEHLPREYKTLSELLSMKSPSVKTREGGEILMDVEELKLVAKIVPKDLHQKLKLPIVLLRRIDLGKGVFSVSGGKVEAYLISKLLNKEGTVNYEKIETPLYIYRPQVQLLRRMLRTLITIGFVTEGVLEFDEPLSWK